MPRNTPPPSPNKKEEHMCQVEVAKPHLCARYWGHRPWGHPFPPPTSFPLLLQGQPPPRFDLWVPCFSWISIACTSMVLVGVFMSRFSGDLPFHMSCFVRFTFDVFSSLKYYSILWISQDAFIPFLVDIGTLLFSLNIFYRSVFLCICIFIASLDMHFYA